MGEKLPVVCASPLVGYYRPTKSIYGSIGVQVFLNASFEVIDKGFGHNSTLGRVELTIQELLELQQGKEGHSRNQ